MSIFTNKFLIKDINAFEILDSRGNPTIEAHVVLRNGIVAVASVPSGASTGIHEAVELRDGDKKRYHGRGVLKAIKRINSIISPSLRGVDVREQKFIDESMVILDGTENKSRLGANSILAVSLACARATSLAQGCELFEYISELSDNRKEFFLPVPSFNIINGGRHANNGLDFQEYMIFPNGVKNFHDRVRAGSEIFYELKNILEERGFLTTVGDEGGFAPILSSNRDALTLIVEAISQTKWRVGRDVSIAMDPATSEVYSAKKYNLNGEIPHLSLSRAEMISYWEELVASYPIVSIEDPLSQDDWSGWRELMIRLGDRIQIVGDDFLVTNPVRIKKAIERQSANAVLIKLNQIGTLTETFEAIRLAREAGWKIMISHRSGETTDTFIADLAVGVGADQIKSGSLNRGERLVKYNRLLAIERILIG